ncbi:hypothetical protein DPEC_G00126540 [Dallia pectoralis]|uniref:Uncharacterized protein n=1 Tax=Dallia pectoralis TaxID=75939 RepID=A0ACC2GRB8_DALPE|nr:hypothetical protein DPEC_G00126540 [Dallia pectoralis]
MVNTVRTRDTPQPRLEERRQMVSTQTMTEDEPRLRYRRYPGSRGEVKGQGSRLQGFGSHNRENRHCRPSMRIPGSYNKSGRAVCPSGGDDPRYQGTPSQSDLSSEEELSGEEGDLDSLFPQPHHQWDHQYRPN